MVQEQRFAHLVADRVQRRQRHHRLLEDHRNVAAADPPDLAAVGGEPDDVDGRLRRAGRREQDLAGRDGRRGWQDAHDRLRRHGLAGAGFSNERQRRAGLDAKRYAIERRNLDAAIVEYDRQVSNVDQRHGGRCAPRRTQPRPSREVGSRLSIRSIKFCPPPKADVRRPLPTAALSSTAASRGCGSGRSCPELRENALTAPFRRVQPTCVPRPQNRNGAAATVSGRRERCESQRRTCAGRARGAAFVPPG